MAALSFMKALKTLPVVFALAVCLTLVGCAGSSASSSSESSSSASSESSSSVSTQASQELVFGTQSATSQNIVFTNKTGADITELSAVPVAGDSAAAQVVTQLMKSGDVWPADAKATVYVETGSDGIYNLSFVNGGSNWQIHNIDFIRYGEMDIRIQDGIAYITAVLDGNPVSTQREEYDIANPPAAAPAVEEEVYVEEQSYYYEEPVYDGGGAAEAAPAQTEDQCVSDVILN